MTLLAAEVSAALVERPIRAGALSRVPARVATAGAVAVCVIAVVASTIPGGGSGAPMGTGVSAMGGRSEVDDLSAVGGLSAVGDLSAVRDLPAVSDFSDRMDPVVPITIAAIPEPGPSDPLRVLVVGDSGPLYLEPGFRPVAESTGAAVVVQAESGCSVLVPDYLSRLSDGRTVRTPPGCPERLDRWRTLVRSFDPDVVLYYLAYAGGSGDARFDGRWVSDCDEGFDRQVHRSLVDEIDLLSAGDAAVAVATTPYSLSNTGEDEDVAVRRVDCRNRVYRQVVSDRPASRLIDLNAYVEGLEESGNGLRQDPVHFSPGGAAAVSSWLLPQLVEMVREP